MQCSAYSICVDECEVERYSTKIDFENTTFTEKSSWKKIELKGSHVFFLYKGTIIIYTMRQTDILQIWYHRITTFIKFQVIGLSSSTHWETLCIKFTLNTVIFSSMTSKSSTKWIDHFGCNKTTLKLLGLYLISYWESQTFTVLMLHRHSAILLMDR